MLPISLALLATVFGVPAALAQGSAPNQGMTQPSTPPILAQPPSVDPSSITDGRPHTDTGGGSTTTAPSTTSDVPLPSRVNTSTEAPLPPGAGPAALPARPGG